MQTTADTLENTSIIAIIKGQQITLAPKDLYIPPDALEIFLEAFEGPLDLLLYLIKKQNLDILDVSIAEITRQYMQYVELMQELRLELAAEYLVMAAMLAEIKSRMLLPRPTEELIDEIDPRAELIRRLQEYERIKQAAEKLEILPRVEREIFIASSEPPDIQKIKLYPAVDLKELVMSLKDVFERAELNTHHQIQREVLSIRERMSQVLGRIQNNSFVVFTELFDLSEGRLGVVVTFIAILELLRQTLIEMVQSEPFAPIHVKAIG